MSERRQGGFGARTTTKTMARRFGFARASIWRNASLRSSEVKTLSFPSAFPLGDAGLTTGRREGCKPRRQATRPLRAGCGKKKKGRRTREKKKRREPCMAAKEESFLLRVEGPFRAAHCLSSALEREREGLLTAGEERNTVVVSDPRDARPYVFSLCASSSSERRGERGRRESKI